MTDTTPFLKRLKSITLSDNEKLAMRERLVSYLDMHPYTAEAASTPANSFFMLFSSRRFSSYAFIALALMVGGGTVTLAAEGSAPGDSLYSIKIHVNEPLMTAFATTNEGQARVAVRLATRRADEAVVLATKGKLTSERQAYLAQAFDTEIKKAATRTDQLESTGNATAAESVKADLAANLAGEAQALGAIPATGNGQDADAKNFLSVIVATSETMGDAADATAALVASTDETASTTAPTDAVPTGGPTGRGTGLGLRTAALLKNASTTPGDEGLKNDLRKQLTGRFARRLHITASTTLRGSLDTANLSIPAPKTDSVIQQLPPTNSLQNLDGNSKELEGLAK